MNKDAKKAWEEKHQGGHFEYGEDYMRGYDKAGKMIFSSHKSGAGTWVSEGDDSFQFEQPEKKK